MPSTTSWRPMMGSRIRCFFTSKLSEALFIATLAVVFSRPRGRTPSLASSDRGRRTQRRVGARDRQGHLRTGRPGATVRRRPPRRSSLRRSRAGPRLSQRPRDRGFRDRRRDPAAKARLGNLRPCRGYGALDRQGRPWRSLPERRSRRRRCRRPPQPSPSGGHRCEPGSTRWPMRSGAVWTSFSTAARAGSVCAGAPDKRPKAPPEDLGEVRFGFMPAPSAPSTIDPSNPTRGEAMNKVRKLVLVTAALGALAVGGAAYAGAQGAGTVAKVTVQKSSTAAETAMSGDTDKVQSGDQNASDQAGEQESGTESADAPDSASEKDAPDGPGDQADGPSDGESPGSSSHGRSLPGARPGRLELVASRIDSDERGQADRAHGDAGQGSRRGGRVPGRGNGAGRDRAAGAGRLPDLQRAPPRADPDRVRQKSRLRPHRPRGPPMRRRWTRRARR